MLKGRAGYQLPQQLGMIVLFEANDNEVKKGKTRAFQAWAVGQLDTHLAYLTSSSPTPAKKKSTSQTRRGCARVFTVAAGAGMSRRRAAATARAAAGLRATST